ncbi:MAG: hypothetical protein OWS74_07715 [Firmicutes bacterium]|nr:hypothetical protein [Bacillota bacterium]
MQLIEYLDCIALERFSAELAAVHQYDVVLPSLVSHEDLEATICLTEDNKVQALLFPLETDEEDLDVYAALQWLTLPHQTGSLRFPPFFALIPECGTVDVALVYPVKPWATRAQQERWAAPIVRPATWQKIGPMLARRSADQEPATAVLWATPQMWFERFPQASDDSFLAVWREIYEYLAIARYYGHATQLHLADPKQAAHLFQQRHVSVKQDWSELAMDFSKVPLDGLLETQPLEGPRTLEASGQCIITLHTMNTGSDIFPLVMLLSYMVRGRLTGLDVYWMPYVPDEDSVQELPSFPALLRAGDYEVSFEEDVLYPLIIKNQRVLSPWDEHWPEF